MIPIKRLSASSISTLDQCEMKWVLQYIMNYREPSGRAAAIGTICHYVLQCVARSKWIEQTGGEYNDEIVGQIKTTYDLDIWTPKIYQHFIGQNPHIAWTDADYREVLRNIEKARLHNLFPANHYEVLEIERFFNMAAASPWGEYAYAKDGEIEKGNVNLVGVIDLVFRDEDGAINILDYKFGDSRDWNTGQKKDYGMLIKDVQLCMYYYAIKERYPDVDVVANLWYVKKEELYSAMFGKDQEEVILDKLQSTLRKIKGIEKPATSYSFKCKFCSFSKTNFADWGRPELDMDYNKVGGKFDEVNGHPCVCDATKVFFDYRGLTATIEGAKAPGEKK